MFMCGDIPLWRGAGQLMTRKEPDLAAESASEPYLEEARNKQNVEDIYMLLTDVPKESVVICNGRYAAEVLSDGFDTQPAADGSCTLPAW